MWVLRRGNARPGADGVVTDGAALSCSGRHTERGLLGRLPGITALSTPELLGVITRGVLEWLLMSELPLAPCRSAADLLSETAGMVLRRALAHACPRRRDVRTG